MDDARGFFFADSSCYIPSRARDIGVAGDIGICTVGSGGNSVCGIVYCRWAGGAEFRIKK
jgi:hypothetical protein